MPEGGNRCPRAKATGGRESPNKDAERAASAPNC